MEKGLPCFINQTSINATAHTDLPPIQSRLTHPKPDIQHHTSNVLLQTSINLKSAIF